MAGPRAGGKGLRRRRIWRALALSAAGLVVFSSGGIALTSRISPSAVAAALADPASLLAKRSPGARGAALFRIKHKAPPAAPVKPGVFGPPGPPADKPPVAGPTEAKLPPPASPPAPPTPALPVDTVIPPPGPPAPGLVILEGPGPEEGGGTTEFAGPGLGGGGPAFISPGGPGGAVVTIPSAVPEPSTWAMLIIGFFGLGAILRARRSGLAHGGA
jgi:hypothetical protein